MTPTQDKDDGSLGAGDTRCQQCADINPVWFAPSPIWNLVMGGPDAKGDPGGILCPKCFITKAEAAGVIPTAWVVAPETDAVVAAIAPNAAPVGAAQHAAQWSWLARQAWDGRMTPTEALSVIRHHPWIKDALTAAGLAGLMKDQTTGAEPRRGSDEQGASLKIPNPERREEIARIISPLAFDSPFIGADPATRQMMEEQQDVAQRDALAKADAILALDRVI